MSNESLLITCLPDGTYHVKETEDPAEGDPNDQAIDQTVKSLDEVQALVAQFINDDQNGDDEQGEGEAPPAGAQDQGGAGAMPMQPSQSAMWMQEAAKRNQSGYR